MERYSGRNNSPMVPDYMTDIPNEPSADQIDRIKDKIVKEFRDVLVMGCWIKHCLFIYTPTFNLRY